MDEKTLANLLRERQVNCGYVNKNIIIRVSDTDIIKSYIQCSDCGKYWISYERAIEIAKNLNNIEEWIKKTQGVCE